MYEYTGIFCVFLIAILHRDNFFIQLLGIEYSFLLHFKGLQRIQKLFISRAKNVNIKNFNIQVALNIRVFFFINRKVETLKRLT